VRLKLFSHNFGHPLVAQDVGWPLYSAGDDGRQPFLDG